MLVEKYSSSSSASLKPLSPASNRCSAGASWLRNRSLKCTTRRKTFYKRSPALRACLYQVWSFQRCCRVLRRSRLTRRRCLSSWQKVTVVLNTVCFRVANAFLCTSSTTSVHLAGSLQRAPFHSLRDNEIGDEGGVALGDALKVNSTLQTLE